MALIVLVVVLGVLLWRLGRRVSGTSPYDIVDLHLSFWAERFSLILASWEHAGGRAALRLSLLLLDFVFAIGYGLLLHGFYLWGPPGRDCWQATL